MTTRTVITVYSMASQTLWSILERFSHIRTSFIFGVEEGIVENWKKKISGGRKKSNRAGRCVMRLTNLNFLALWMKETYCWRRLYDLPFGIELGIKIITVDTRIPVINYWMNEPILVFTRFGFPEDGLMLRSSLIVIEWDRGCESVVTKTQKGEVENGIHWTGSPCRCSRDVVNGAVLPSMNDEPPCATVTDERRAKWDPIESQKRQNTNKDNTRDITRRNFKVRKGQYVAWYNSRTYCWTMHFPWAVIMKWF